MVHSVFLYETGVSGGYWQTVLWQTCKQTVKSNFIDAQGALVGVLVLDRLDLKMRQESSYWIKLTVAFYVHVNTQINVHYCTMSCSCSIGQPESPRLLTRVKVCRSFRWYWDSTCLHMFALKQTSLNCPINICQVELIFIFCFRLRLLVSSCFICYITSTTSCLSAE